MLFHSIHPSIHRLCAAFWMDVSFDQLYPSSCIFFSFYIFVVFCLCRTFHFTLHTLQPFTHQLILTVPPPLLLSPKGLSILPITQVYLDYHKANCLLKTGSTSFAIWHDPQYHHLPFIQTIFLRSITAVILLILLTRFCKPFLRPHSR
jgi:hypothetical protein